MSQPSDEPVPISPDQGDGERLPLVDLDALPARPPSLRKRVVQVGLLLAALVMVMVTFWRVVVPTSAPGLPVPLQPTALPRALSLLSNINYGTLTLNGHPLSDQQTQTIRLPSKPPYTLTLNAPPFRPLSCPFPPPAPPAPYGFTPCLAGGEFTLNQQSVTTLQMLFTLADLPPAQQQQITSLIPQAVTAEQTITAPAQSFIVTALPPDGTITTERLPEPLEASAALIPSQQNGLGGTACQSFICTDSGVFQLNNALSGQFWEVTTPAALRWRFTTASGHVVSEVTFPIAAYPTLFLSYTATTGWQVGLVSPAQLSQDLTHLICSTGTGMLASAAQQQTNEGYWGATTLHDQGIEGCELSLQLNGVDQGQFVWRFGVLLAVDAKAHSALPTLPIATPADLAAVGG